MLQRMEAHEDVVRQRCVAARYESSTAAVSAYSAALLANAVVQGRDAVSSHEL